MSPKTDRAPRGPGVGPAKRAREVLRRARPTEDSELFAEIAGQVVKLRERWGLSQRELADLCGTTQSAIARMERGLRPPRIDTLRRVAAALDAELLVELRPRTNPDSTAPNRRSGGSRSRRSD